MDYPKLLSEIMQSIHITNPFDSEIDSIYSSDDTEQEFDIIPSPYLSQVKSYQYENHIGYSNEILSPIYPPPNLDIHPAAKSKSSPIISGQVFTNRSCRSPSLGYPNNLDETDSDRPLRCGSFTSFSESKHFKYDTSKRLNSSSEKHCLFCSTSGSQSPFLKIGGNTSCTHSSAPQKMKSPTSTFYEFMMLHEPEDDFQQLKRSRSTTKKMFGENGWLGVSPDEALSLWNRDPDNASRLKDKTSVIERLRHKLVELAHKADINSSLSSRMHRDNKNERISVLTVSLGPPEQARIFTEVELMLAHTANSFLMNNFSLGRMSVNSIKRTVDTWKSKGRPVVTEFMYDQATQCELVALNQHNFRFHGRQASDELRINSMLYNWKQVSGLISVRTFCSADTVILKMLFDIKQILELLGANESFILRLQQIHISALKMMKYPHQKENNFI